jgi:protein TonB
MMVSIIAPPSPEPEIVPIVEPPKPEPKPIVKPKKVVEKILPIEVPVERLVEATTELPKEEPVIQPEAAPIIPAEPAKAPARAEPVVEDKVEPPKFGVSYLNNPAPDYPALSVRKGEEGRVLMRVLVSAEGKAEDVQIEQSSGFDRLDNVAVAAVKKWRFIPAKKNNQPLSAYVLVPMPFIIEK